MQAITYPDGETVRYGYDYGGNVVSVAGTKQGQAFPYVDKIGYDEWGQRVYLKLGNGVETTYTYNEDRRWLSRVLTESAGQAGKPVLQDIQYNFDLAGNILSYANTAGTYSTSQEYAYDGLYQLVYAKGVSVNKPHGDFDYRAEYTQTYQFDALGLGNMTEKRSWTANTDPRRLGDPLDYEQDYAYAAGFAHRAERIGRRHYRYDLNGNVATEQDGPFSTVVSTGGHTITELENGTKVVDNGWGMNDNGVTIPAPKVWKREYAWNERNLLRTSRDDQHIVEYTYGQDGERSGKYSMTADGGHRHETLYFNKMWTWHYDGLLNEFTGRNSKHVYLGESRIVTKISRADNGGSTAEERIKQYYYHSDHLGSAQVISNADGQEYERIEYTPYGELWIEKASTASNIDIPYRFTGKERDEETGLYYYGARYLDSKASRWLSTDPALGDYIPGAPVDDEARKQNQSLPGMGGVFNTVNLHLYHYAGNNPVKYTDPDGKADAANILRTGWSIADSISQADGPLLIGETIGLVIGIGASLIAGGVAIYNAVANSNEKALQKATTMMTVAATAAPPPPDDPNGKGTRTSSKTLHNKNGIRIDVENPGNRPGQIHIHKGNGKYLYDIVSQTLKTVGGDTAPTAVQELMNNPEVIKAIAKGLQYLGY
jgi:RHS repeat-associated protein